MKFEIISEAKVREKTVNFIRYTAREVMKRVPQQDKGIKSMPQEDFAQLIVTKVILLQFSVI